MFCLVILPKGCVDDGTISTWRSDHPGRIHSDDLSPQSLPDVSSLFDEKPSIEFSVESALAADIRAVNTSAGEDIDVLVITSTPTSAKFTRDGIDVVDLSLPKNTSVLTTMIAKTEKVPTQVATRCVSRGSTPASAMIMARQIALLDTEDRRAESLVWDPWRQDPPWSVTDSISSGNCSGAARAVLDMTAAGADPYSLMFQILGYFRKVAVCRDDPGGILGGGNTGIFSAKRRMLTDYQGLVNDLADTSDRVFTSEHPRHALAASVAVMAQRFSDGSRIR